MKEAEEKPDADRRQLVRFISAEWPMDSRTSEWSLGHGLHFNIVSHLTPIHWQSLLGIYSLTPGLGG